MKHLTPFKVFESVELDNDGISDIKDILLNISECSFKSKLVQNYDSNRYLGRGNRKSTDVLFLWTDGFENTDKSFLHGLYFYKDKIPQMFGYHIHYVFFKDDFVLLIMILNKDVNLSKRFIRDVFKDDYEVTSKIKDNISDSYTSADIFSAKLNSGILYQNGDRSNLSLYDWQYKNMEIKF